MSRRLAFVLLLLPGCIDPLEGASCESDGDCLDYVCDGGRCTDRERVSSSGAGGSIAPDPGPDPDPDPDPGPDPDPTPAGPETVVTGLTSPFELRGHGAELVWTMASSPGSFGRVNTDGTNARILELAGSRFFVGAPSTALHGDVLYAASDVLGLVAWSLRNDTVTQYYADASGYARGPVAADASGVYWVTDDRASSGQAIRAMRHGGGEVRTVVAGLDGVSALVFAGSELVIAADAGVFAVPSGGGVLREIGEPFREPTALVGSADGAFWADAGGLHRYVAGAARAGTFGQGLGLDVAQGLAVGGGSLFAATGSGLAYEVPLSTGVARAIAGTRGSGASIAADSRWVWYFDGGSLERARRSP